MIAPVFARRRRLLGAALGGAGVATAALAAGTEHTPSAIDWGEVTPGRQLGFPADHGAHPRFRTEWWYLTAWLQVDDREYGFQLTFFRSRTRHSPANPSRFAPHQLLLAHVALADASHQRLRHDQRAARLGFRDAQMRLDDTQLRIGDWTLERGADDRYRLSAEATEFGAQLTCVPDTAPFAQGDAGYSRKGPLPSQASYYYSRPRLAIDGRIRLGTRERAVQSGRGWLDHEWSTSVLDPRAAGWDWIGLNLEDGTALMAFRIRGRDGSVLWRHASWLDRGGNIRAVDFEPLRLWRSPRSNAVYPVELRLRVDTRTILLVPLMDDQELDARASTGGFYWEGAVRAIEHGRPIGGGYLELTGYAAPLAL